MKPTPRTWPDEWAARNRIYPATAGIPGPRKPSLTPYVIPFCRAVSGGAYKRVVFVTAAQMGKTDGVIDLMGCRLDQRPAPVIYVGPSREFLTDQFEPRLMDLLDQAASLAKKVVRGRRMKKTRKIISGVPVRLAHAGSSTALKSDPAALAIVDEYDEMLANVRGQGDPLGLVEARGFTFADFCAAITSTPSRGIVDTEIDTQSGLEFWKIAEAQDLESGIWKLFQEGTRYHWAWPCPACDAYFIPRFKLLRWPEKATPAEAKRGAWLECPHCGGVIEEADRPAMNARGVYVAPGQSVDVEGVVHGEPADTSTCSFWVSGLASPFVTLGERAEAYLKALASGEDDKVQTAINAGFGQCYAEGLSGDAIDWKEVAAKRVPYRTGEVPRGVLRLTAGIDVQARSLYYVIRGWGSLARSWLIDYGQLFGPTHEDAVWDELLAILTRSYDGLVVEKAMIDSGFRPGKPGAGDDHAVYEFTRKHAWLCLPTKGHDRQPTPIRAAQIEVTAKGQRAPRSQTLWHLDSDFFKSQVHSRLRIEHGRPGAFYLPEDASDDYCRQLVSEWRTISPDNARAHWVVRNRNNHLLDAEALAAAAAYMLRVHTIPDGVLREAPVPPPVGDETASDIASTKTSIRARFAGLAARANR